MIICTNCNHENPEGSVQCENCYAPLPKTSPCPNCGSLTQINAAFCGQCGYNLLSEEPLAFIDSDDDSGILLESKDTIPHQTLNYSFKKPWENQAEENKDNSEIPISDLEDETEFLSADLSESEFSTLEELEIAGPDLELTPEISPESAAIDDEIAELEEPEELEASQELQELQESAELSLDTNSEPDSFELDLEPDLEPDLAAELTELPEIEGLEDTIDKSISEISSVKELEEALEIEDSNLDLTPEIIEEPIAIDNERLEIASPDLDLTSEAEIAEASSPAVSASERPAVPSPRSLSQPIHPVSESATRLQLERIILSHVQTNTDIELSQNLDIIRIGKPNNQVPPDIDVSGFPDANIVSRVHANILVEGNSYFIEDAGSSNGTYINHKPLVSGNRHRLRFGDRIALGKGDLMTFIFKIINE